MCWPFIAIDNTKAEWRILPRWLISVLNILITLNDKLNLIWWFAGNHVEFALKFRNVNSTISITNPGIIFRAVVREILTTSDHQMAMTSHIKSWSLMVKIGLRLQCKLVVQCGSSGWEIYVCFFLYCATVLLSVCFVSFESA